jgi:hypothetical protein
MFASPASCTLTCSFAPVFLLMRPPNHGFVSPSRTISPSPGAFPSHTTGTRVGAWLPRDTGACKLPASFLLSYSRRLLRGWQKGKSRAFVVGPREAAVHACREGRVMESSQNAQATWHVHCPLRDRGLVCRTSLLQRELASASKLQRGVPCLGFGLIPCLAVRESAGPRQIPFINGCQVASRHLMIPTSRCKHPILAGLVLSPTRKAGGKS